MYLGLGAGPYSFSTTVQFIPTTGSFFKDLFTGHKNFSMAEKSQIDWWMQNQASFDVINKVEDSVGNLYYIISGKDAKLVNDTIDRVKPQIAKFSDTKYAVLQAIKEGTQEAAGIVGQAGAKVIEVAGGAAKELATPIVKAAFPYVLGGVIILGGVFFLYMEGQKKVRSYVTRS